MSRLIDQASDLETRQREQAIARHQANIATQRERNYQSQQSKAICVDCGGEIPQARREAVPGCETCIFCQQYREKGYP